MRHVQESASPRTPLRYCPAGGHDDGCDHCRDCSCRKWRAALAALGSKRGFPLRPGVVRSFEPDEDWFWTYATEEYADRPVLAPLEHHPLAQPVPGPAGRVPRYWQRHLH